MSHLARTTRFGDCIHIGAYAGYLSRKFLTRLFVRATEAQAEQAASHVGYMRSANAIDLDKEPG